MKNEDEWDWIRFLRGAVEREPDLRVVLEAQTLADQWPTCACGQLCKDLPRLERGEMVGVPNDQELRILGCDFASAVRFSDWPLALEVFEKIEQRTSELLRVLPD